MLISLLVLFLYSFNFGVFYFCTQKSFFSHDLYVFFDKAFISSVISLLKLSSVIGGSIFIEFSGLNSSLIGQVLLFDIFYFFYNPKLGTKLHLISALFSNSSLPSLSKFFQGLEWAEREVSEMLGIEFLFKMDNRKLLLDYSFTGFPLLRHYYTMGYFEIVFNHETGDLFYSALYNAESVFDDIYFLTN